MFTQTIEWNTFGFWKKNSGAKNEVKTGWKTERGVGSEIQKGGWREKKMIERNN